MNELVQSDCIKICRSVTWNVNSVLQKWDWGQIYTSDESVHTIPVHTPASTPEQPFKLSTQPYTHIETDITQLLRDTLTNIQTERQTDGVLLNANKRMHKLTNDVKYFATERSTFNKSLQFSNLQHKLALTWQVTMLVNENEKLRGEFRGFGELNQKSNSNVLQSIVTPIISQFYQGTKK